MKFCFHISGRLVAYCEGEIRPHERERIAAHLDKCANCRARAEEIRNNVYLMRQLPLRNPAGQLWYSIQSQLRNSTENDLALSGRRKETKPMTEGVRRRSLPLPQDCRWDC